jgi:hypothetical protein
MADSASSLIPEPPKHLRDGKEIEDGVTCSSDERSSRWNCLPSTRQGGQTPSGNALATGRPRTVAYLFPVLRQFALQFHSPCLAQKG